MAGALESSSPGGEPRGLPTGVGPSAIGLPGMAGALAGTGPRGGLLGIGLVGDGGLALTGGGGDGGVALPGGGGDGVFAGVGAGARDLLLEEGPGAGADEGGGGRGGGEGEGDVLELSKPEGIITVLICNTDMLYG